MKKIITVCILAIGIIACNESKEVREKIDSPNIKGTEKYINSREYNSKKVAALIINRINEGVYNGYKVDLCVDKPERCESLSYSKVTKKDERFFITISNDEWSEYPDQLKDEILNEIIYYTWGHKKNKYSPLVVTTQNNSSPLELLNPSSKEMFMNFSKSEYLKGGNGKNAYGPNCWYNAISSIVGSKSQYSKSKQLRASDWNRPRFMGATEFRCYMDKFEKVDAPKYGDILRYYSDSTYYDESIILYNGEVHAATYIGADTSNKIEEIILTKNGRNDLGFLILQDSKESDSYYLSTDDNDPRVKGFFRVKPKSKFFDPAICGKCSDCYEAYKIDSINYHKRWKCLSGELNTCYDSISCYDCYPSNWNLLKN